jgi:acyl carrier protein
MSDTLEALLKMAQADLGLEDKKVDPDLTFTELGLDSLSLVDFLFSVEDRYGITIDPERAMAQPTLAGLAELVNQVVIESRPLAA